MPVSININITWLFFTKCCVICFVDVHINDLLLEVINQNGLVLHRIALTTFSASTSHTQVGRTSLAYPLPSILSCLRSGNSWHFSKSSMDFTTVSSTLSTATMTFHGPTSILTESTMNYLSFSRGEKVTEVKLNFWISTFWQSYNKLHWKAWKHQGISIVLLCSW